MEFRLGRSSDCEIQLPHGSVSRVHASVLRMHERFAIRDESSRLGTKINGERTHFDFLSPGDKIVLGKIRLTYEERREIDARPPSQAGAYMIDSQAFDVLADMRHPSTARAAVAFLVAADRLQWIEEELRQLGVRNDEECQRLARSVRRLYTDEVERAREALPHLLGKSATSTTGWLALLQKKKRSLPPQVLPVGWGLPL